MSGKAKDCSVILSVFVNRIGFGYAVLENGALIDWGAKDLRQAGHTPALAAFSSLLKAYKPTLVAMRAHQGDSTHRGDRVRMLLRSMSGVAQRKRITLSRFSRQAIQAYFGGIGVRNKHQLAREIARRLPELEDRIPRERRLWEPEEYAMGIFDAAALALMCLDEQAGSR